MNQSDPRRVAAAVGRLTGNEEIAEDVLSGRMNSTDVAPLLGGFVDGVIRELFAPIVGVRDWSGFEPTDRPLTGTVTLGDGSRLVITIAPEAES